MKSCALCNAYKTVYGSVSYLQHRLQKKLSTQSSEGTNNIQNDSSGDDSLYEYSPKRADEGSASYQGKSSNDSSPRNVSSSRTKDGLHKEPATTMANDQDVFNGDLNEVSCNPSALFAQYPTSTPFPSNKTKSKMSKMIQKKPKPTNTVKPSANYQISKNCENNRRRSKHKNNSSDVEDLEVRELRLSDSESDRETEHLTGRRGNETEESSSPDKEFEPRKHGGSSYDRSIKLSGKRGTESEVSSSPDKGIVPMQHGGSSYEEEESISPPRSPRDFDVKRRIVRTVEAREKLSYSDESQRIHNRIKELMRKNESVLVGNYFLFIIFYRPDTELGKVSLIQRM